MKSSDHLLSDSNYPSSNSHEGYLIQQLQLVREALIEDIGSLLNTTDDTSPNLETCGAYKAANDTQLDNESK